MESRLKRVEEELLFVTRQLSYKNTKIEDLLRTQHSLMQRCNVLETAHHRLGTYYDMIQPHLPLLIRMLLMKLNPEFCAEEDWTVRNFALAVPFSDNIQVYQLLNGLKLTVTGKICQTPSFTFPPSLELLELKFSMDDVDCSRIPATSDGTRSQSLYFFTPNVHNFSELRILDTLTELSIYSRCALEDLSEIHLPWGLRSLNIHLEEAMDLSGMHIPFSVKRLDFSFSNFTSVSQLPPIPPTVEYLMFNVNRHITDFGMLQFDTSSSSCLQNVAFTHCNITDCACLPELPSSVTQLNLLGNPIVNLKKEDIPPTVLSLRVQLDLITHTPEVFYFSDTIRYLELIVNKREYHPLYGPVHDKLSCLHLPTNLESLVMDGNELPNVRALALPCKLKYLDLSSNLLSVLKDLPRLPWSLQRINLSCNPMAQSEKQNIEQKVWCAHNRLRCILELCRLSNYHPPEPQPQSDLRLHMHSLCEFKHIRKTIFEYWSASQI